MFHVPTIAGYSAPPQVTCSLSSTFYRALSATTPLLPPSHLSHPPRLPRESDITKERIKKILDAGANIVLCTGGIDDLCLKYFVEAGAMAVRRVKKEDLKRIARATGGMYISYVHCFRVWC